MHKNQSAECSGLQWWLNGLKKNIKGGQCELAKDPPMFKSIFSLEHKDGELVNSRTYLGLLRLDPFIET